MGTVRRFLRFLRDEGLFFFRYSRAHPRFKWYLAIDAVIAVLLVVIGIQVGTQSTREEVAETRKMSGGVALSASELINLVHHEKINAYWIGPVDGNTYTLVATNPDAILISYIPKGEDIPNFHQKDLVVQTNVLKGESEAKMFADSQVGGVDFIVNQGNAIHYNAVRPDVVSISIKGTSSVVQIFDPIEQASLTLAMNPYKLQKV